MHIKCPICHKDVDTTFGNYCENCGFKFDDLPPSTAPEDAAGDAEDIPASLEYLLDKKKTGASAENPGEPAPAPKAKTAVKLFASDLPAEQRKTLCLSKIELLFGLLENSDDLEIMEKIVSSIKNLYTIIDHLSLA
jgi:hypothetical protein